ERVYDENRQHADNPTDQCVHRRIGPHVPPAQSVGGPPRSTKRRSTGSFGRTAMAARTAPGSSTTRSGAVPKPSWRWWQAPAAQVHDAGCASDPTRTAWSRCTLPTISLGANHDQVHRGSAQKSGTRRKRSNASWRRTTHGITGVNRLRPLVQLQAATRTYTLGGKDVEAVCDVDLALQPGELVSIV